MIQSNFIWVSHLAMFDVRAMQGGDLRAALDGANGADYLWGRRGARIAADITRGLAYIHSTGVVHRCVRLLVALACPQKIGRLRALGTATAICSGSRADDGVPAAHMPRPEPYKATCSTLPIEVTAWGKGPLEGSKKTFNIANVRRRDLKSSNVLLTAEGVAKVADIGAAALMNAECVPCSASADGSHMKCSSDPRYESCWLVGWDLDT